MKLLSGREKKILRTTLKQWEEIQDKEMSISEDLRNQKRLAQSIKMIGLITNSIMTGVLGGTND